MPSTLTFTFVALCAYSFCYMVSLFSYDKTNEMHKFLKFISGIELYMSRTGFLSIIMSLVLYTQQYVYVIQVLLTAC